MTTIQLPRPPARTKAAPARPPPSNGELVPPLVNGDRLSQPEFHRRYEAMPPGTKAELIGGVVYMASPLRMPHSGAHTRLIGAVVVYQAQTPGVDVGAEVTVILDEDSEPQPDIHVRLLPAYGGATTENPDEYLVGPPELIIEIAHSSEAIDLHAKRLDYEANGVPEYLVFCVRERALRAFDLKTGRELAVGTDGVYRSKSFPGLWLDVAAAFAADTPRVLKALRKGLKSPEHAAFVKRLEAKVRPSRPGESRGRRRSRG